MYIDLRGKELEFKVVPSTFERYFTVDEEEKLVNDLYNRYTFNGGTGRLEDINVWGDKAKITFSNSKFYHLLTTTLLINRSGDLPDKAGDFIREVKERGSLNDIHSVLGNKLLSNDVAVSVMIRDREGSYILARRGAKVSVGVTLLSTSVTGSMDDTDLKQKNPVVYTAKREILEEAHIPCKEIEVEIQGLFMGKDKLQPVFICNAEYHGVFNDEWLDNSVLLSSENKYFNKLTEDGVKGYRFAKGRLSEAGEFHLELIKGGNT